MLQRWDLINKHGNKCVIWIHTVFIAEQFSYEEVGFYARYYCLLHANVLCFFSMKNELVCFQQVWDINKLASFFVCFLFLSFFFWFSLQSVMKENFA